jgi:catechol 2,3-dioxygenase-like lactoylglutathione lyase family enzyme
MKIQRLELPTSPLAEMKAFYAGTLGFPLLQETKDSFTLRAGITTLQFYRAAGDPYYHFAFNIPSGSIDAAMTWLEPRVPLLPWNGKKRVVFDHWNAFACYFYDPAGNICELIARDRLGIPLQEPFSTSSILSVSELGIASENRVMETLQQFQTAAGIGPYDCDDAFCAMGDEEGLFIVVDRLRKKWIPNLEEARELPFRVEIEAEGRHEISFREGQLHTRPL